MSDVSLVGVAGVSLGVALGMASGCVNFQNSQKSRNSKKKHMSPKSILYVRCLIVFSCIKSGYLLGDSRKGQHKK